VPCPVRKEAHRESGKNYRKPVSFTGERSAEFDGPGCPGIPIAPVRIARNARYAEGGRRPGHIQLAMTQMHDGGFRLGEREDGILGTPVISVGMVKEGSSASSTSRWPSGPMMLRSSASMAARKPGRRASQYCSYSQLRIIRVLGQRIRLSPLP
jgi:hypothetical protein